MTAGGRVRSAMPCEVLFFKRYFVLYLSAYTPLTIIMCAMLHYSSVQPYTRLECVAAAGGGRYGGHCAVQLPRKGAFACLCNLSCTRLSVFCQLPHKGAFACLFNACACLFNVFACLFNAFACLFNVFACLCNLSCTRLSAFCVIFCSSVVRYGGHCGVQ
jgi:hypothetical protein